MCAPIISGAVIGTYRNLRGSKANMETDASLLFIDDRSSCFYLSHLFPQHGGACVDNKHHVLGHNRQVFGGKVVHEVSV